MPLALAAVVDYYLGAIYLLCALLCCFQSDRGRQEMLGHDTFGEMLARRLTV